jgi:hypothetical protein
LFSVTVFTLIGLIVDIVEDATNTTIARVVRDIVIESNYGFSSPAAQYDDAGTVKIIVWFQWTSTLAFTIGSYFFVERHFRNIRILRDTLTNFNVAETKLGKENDRGLLLGIINELFVEEDANEEDAALRTPLNANAAAERIGHALHTHIIEGSQSPNRQSVDSSIPIAEPVKIIMPAEGPADATDAGGISKDNAGLSAFNRSLQVNVRHQLPTTGIRSWAILGYKTSVLCAAVIRYSYGALFDYQDVWGFIKTDSALSTFQSTGLYGLGSLGEGFLSRTTRIGSNMLNPQTFAQLENSSVIAPYQNWRSVAGLMYTMLILNPFQLFCGFARIKLWLKKNSRNFRVNGEMRGKFSVIRPPIAKFLIEIDMKLQREIMANFQILAPKSNFEFCNP